MLAAMRESKGLSKWLPVSEQGGDEVMGGEDEGGCDGGGDGSNDSDDGDGDSDDNGSDHESEWFNRNVEGNNGGEQQTRRIDESSTFYNQRQADEEEGGLEDEEGGEEEGEGLDELSAKAYQLFALAPEERPLFKNAEERVQLILRFSRARRRALAEPSADANQVYQQLRVELLAACREAYRFVNALIAQYTTAAEQEVAIEGFDLAAQLIAHFNRRKPRVQAQRFVIDHINRPGCVQQHLHQQEMLQRRAPCCDPMELSNESIEKGSAKLKRDRESVAELGAEEAALRQQLSAIMRKRGPLKRALKEGEEMMALAARQKANRE